MNDELLDKLWKQAGGDAIGSFDEFKNEFNTVPELRDKLWKQAGGEAIGSFDEFLVEAGYQEPAPEVAEPIQSEQAEVPTDIIGDRAKKEVIGTEPEGNDALLGLKAGYKGLVSNVMKIPGFIAKDAPNAVIQAAGDLLEKAPVIGDIVFPTEESKESFDRSLEFATETSSGAIVKKSIGESDFVKRQEAEAEEITSKLRGQFGNKNTVELLTEGEFGKAAESLGIDMMQGLPSLAVAATGPIGFGALGLGEASSTYNDLVGSGVDKKTSLVAGTMSGLAEYIFEKVGTGEIFKRIKNDIKNRGKEEVKKGLVNSLGRVLKEGGVEGLTETLTGLSQSLIEDVAKDDFPKTKEEFVKRYVTDPVSQGLAGVGLGAGARSAAEIAINSSGVESSDVDKDSVVNSTVTPEQKKVFREDAVSELRSNLFDSQEITEDQKDQKAQEIIDRPSYTPREAALTALSSNTKFNRDSLIEELGLNEGDRQTGEVKVGREGQTKLLKWSGKDSKLTIQGLAENIVAQEESNSGIKLDVQDVRNELIDILNQHESVSQVRETVKNELAVPEIESEIGQQVDPEFFSAAVENEISNLQDPEVFQVLNDIIDPFVKDGKLDNQGLANAILNEDIEIPDDLQNVVKSLAIGQSTINEDGSIQNVGVDGKINEEPTQSRFADQVEGSGIQLQERLKQRIKDDPRISENSKSAISEKLSDTYEVLSHREVDRITRSEVEQAKSEGNLEVLEKEVDELSSKDTKDPTVGGFRTMFYQKLMFEYDKMGDIDGFKRVSEKLRSVSKSSGRQVSALQESASPESLVNRFRERQLERREQFFDEYSEAISQLKQDLKAPKKKVNQKKGKERTKAALDRLKDFAAKKRDEGGKLGFAAKSPKDQGFQDADDLKELISIAKEIAQGLIEQGVSDVKKVIDGVAKELKGALGLNDKQARDIAGQAVSSNDSDINDSVNEFLKKLGGKTNKKSVTDLAGKLKGAITEEQFDRALGEAMGYELSADVVAELNNKLNQVLEAKSGIEENFRMRDLKTYLKKNDGEPWYNDAVDFISEVYYVNMLSGISTLQRASIGGITTAINDLISDTLANPKASMFFAKNFLFSGMGMIAGSGEARTIWKTGLSPLEFTELSPESEKIFDRIVNKSYVEYVKDIASGNEISKNAFKAVAKFFFGLPLRMYRGLMAVDAILKHGLIEYNSFIDLYNKELGLGTETKKVIGNVKDKFGHHKIPEFKLQAEKEYQMLVDSGLKIPGYKRQRVKELLMEYRGHDVSKSAKDRAVESLLMNDPNGILGKAAGLIKMGSNPSKIESTDTTFQKAVKAGLIPLQFALRTVFPFLRVPVNFVNYATDYITPVGIARAAFEQDPIIQKRKISRAVQGAVIAMVPWMLGADEDDEERSWRITGSGTESYTRNQTIDESWKELQIQIKIDPSGPWSKENTFSYSYKDNPIGIILYPWGQFMDKRMLGEKMPPPVQGAIMNAVQFSSQQTFSSGVDELYKLFTSLDDSDKFKTRSSKFAERRLSTLAVPNLYKQAGDMYDAFMDIPQRTDDDLVGRVLKDAPFINTFMTDEIQKDLIGQDYIKNFQMPMFYGAFEYLAAKAKPEIINRNAHLKVFYKFPEVTLKDYYPKSTVKGKRLDNKTYHEARRVYNNAIRQEFLSNYKMWESIDDPEVMQKQIDAAQSRAKQKARLFIVGSN